MLLCFCQDLLNKIKIMFSTITEMIKISYVQFSKKKVFLIRSLYQLLGPFIIDWKLVISLVLILSWFPGDHRRHKFQSIFGPRREKTCLRCLRTTKAQTSLRIRAD